MGLGSLIRNVALPVAKKVLGGQDGILDNVTVRFWNHDTDVEGTPDYDSPIPFQALVVREQKVVSKDGQEVMSVTQVFFLEEIPARGYALRDEPIDERDVITLSDGTTGPILAVGGLMDQATSSPYYLEVSLG